MQNNLTRRQELRPAESKISAGHSTWMSFLATFITRQWMQSFSRQKLAANSTFQATSTLTRAWFKREEQTTLRC